MSVRLIREKYTHLHTQNSQIYYDIYLRSINDLQQPPHSLFLSSQAGGMKMPRYEICVTKLSRTSLVWDTFHIKD